MLGGNPGKDRYPPGGLHQLLCRQALDFGPRQEQVVVHYADLARDMPRSQGVIAGDHGGADPGPVAAGDRIADLGAGRVDHAEQPEQDEAVLHRLLLGLLGKPVPRAHADGEHPHPLGGHVVVGCLNPPFPCVVQRPALPLHPDMAANRDHSVHGTLGEGDEGGRSGPIPPLPEGTEALRDLRVGQGRAVQGGHALADRIEGDLADAGKSARQVVLENAGAGGGQDQRSFRGIPDRVPEPPGCAVPGQRSVVAERARNQKQVERRPDPRGGNFPAGLEGERSPVVVLVQTDGVVGYIERDDAHPVQGQGSRLVRADTGDGAERLHRRELADERLAPEHTLGTQREGDRDHSRQRLGHRRDRQAHGGQEQLLDAALRPDPSEEEHERHQPQSPLGQGLPEAVEPPLQRGILSLHRLYQVSHVTQFGPHAGFGNHEGAAAIANDGPAVYHVSAVPERLGGVEPDLCRFLHRLRLPRQRRFVDAEVDPLEDAPVRGDDVAVFQEHDVPRHQIPCGGLEHPSAAADPNNGHRHPPECGHGLFRPRLLHVAEHRVQKNDAEDDNRLQPVAQQAADQGRDQQEHGQHPAELLGQDLPARPPLLLLQLVPAVFQPARRDLLIGESPGSVAPENLQHIGCRQGMPFVFHR